MPSVGGVGARTGSIGTASGTRSTGNYSGGGIGSAVGGATARSNTQSGGNAQSGGKMGSASSQSGGVKSSGSVSGASRSTAGKTSGSSLGGNAQSGGKISGGYSGPKGTPAGGLNTAARAASASVGRSKTGGSGNALSAGIASGKMQSTQSPMNRTGGNAPGRISSGNALAASYQSRNTSTLPGRSPDPGVLGVAGGVSGRMSPAYQNRFNFTGGAKARGGTNPFGGTSTPAVGQMIGFADHLRAQGIMDPLNVVSAFRSQATQNALRKANPASAAAGRIAKHSAHTSGQAIDITHPAMSNTELAAQVASYPGFNKMMGYGYKGNPKQGSHVHVEAGEGPLKGLGYIGGQRTADIAKNAPQPTQTASLGPQPQSMPRSPNQTIASILASAAKPAPPIPQRNPLRTNIPVPQRASVAGRIAAQGIPMPEPGRPSKGLTAADIAATGRSVPYGGAMPPSTFAGAGQPSYSEPQVASAPQQRNPMTSSTPATMVDYDRVIDALERDLARQRQAPQPNRAAQENSGFGGVRSSNAVVDPGLNYPSAAPRPSGPSAPNADMIARAYSEDARLNERRYDAPRLAFRALNTPPDPSNLSGGPPNRSPYYSQGDMSEAETYAGPFDPRMGTDAEIDGLPAPADQTQYQTQQAPSIDPSVLFGGIATPQQMLDGAVNTINPPNIHEIQQPGQVPGMPSQIADVGQQTPMQHGIEQGIDDFADRWNEAESYIATANNGGRNMNRGSDGRLNDLAQQVVSADPSQAENLDNPLWWVWLQQMMQQQGAVA
jgi:hypothetical protein